MVEQPKQNVDVVSNDNSPNTNTELTAVADSVDPFYNLDLTTETGKATAIENILTGLNKADPISGFLAKNLAGDMLKNYLSSDETEAIKDQI